MICTPFHFLFIIDFKYHFEWSFKVLCLLLSFQPALELSETSDNWHSPQLKIQHVQQNCVPDEKCTTPSAPPVKATSRLTNELNYPKHLDYHISNHSPYSQRHPHHPSAHWQPSTLSHDPMVSPLSSLNNSTVSITSRIHAHAGINDSRSTTLTGPQNQQTYLKPIEEKNRRQQSATGLYMYLKLWVRLIAATVVD